jgi:hypothetical protein
MKLIIVHYKYNLYILYIYIVIITYLKQIIYIYLLLLLFWLLLSLLLIYVYIYFTHISHLYPHDWLVHASWFSLQLAPRWCSLGPCFPGSAAWVKLNGHPLEIHWKWRKSIGNPLKMVENPTFNLL